MGVTDLSPETQLVPVHDQYFGVSEHPVATTREQEYGM